MKRAPVLSSIIAIFAAILSGCTIDAPQTAGGTQILGQPAPPPMMPARPPPSSGPSNLLNGAPWIHAESYILLNPDNGVVISAKNADMPHSVASTQKVLTALCVLDCGDLDKPVRISSSDIAVEPSKLGVRPGEVYSRRVLLTAFLVKSANDVANALARDCAGSIEAFAARMNAKARSVGAVNSYFVNPHGLDSHGQHSTARDMSRIAMAAYHNGFIRDVVRRQYYSFRFASGRVTTLKNTNELLGHMPECDGMKTGYTGPAGRCLISTAHSGSRDIMLVQLGTRTKWIWDDGALLMRWGLGR